ncbi:MAG: uracil-DNA glycosylase [Thermoguttaceae bacterium]
MISKQALIDYLEVLQMSGLADWGPFDLSQPLCSFSVEQIVNQDEQQMLNDTTLDELKQATSCVNHKEIAEKNGVSDQVCHIEPVSYNESVRHNEREPVRCEESVRCERGEEVKQDYLEEGENRVTMQNRDTTSKITGEKSEKGGKGIKEENSTEMRGDRESQKERGRRSPVDRVVELEQIANEVAQCKQCRELAKTRTQTVFGVGNPFAELVFIGEAPGADEDKQGIPFVGRAGQLLTDMMTKGMGLTRESVYICNILRCRPPGNRNPEPNEATNCRPFLDATLNVIQPKYICCLGAIAAQNLLQTNETIGHLRGQVLEYNGCKVICTYHPAYLLRNPSAKGKTWEDLQLLMKEMGLPLPKK